MQKTVLKCLLSVLLLSAGCKDKVTAETSETVSETDTSSDTGTADVDDPAEQLWVSSCTDTCERLYARDQCALVKPGWTTEELIERCVGDCGELYGVEGGLDGYDPMTAATSSESPQLENQTQAEAWMDCIDVTACDQLQEGYCAPIR